VTIAAKAGVELKARIKNALIKMFFTRAPCHGTSDKLTLEQLLSRLPFVFLKNMLMIGCGGG